MKRIPADRYYTEVHLWFHTSNKKDIAEKGEAEGFVGLTDHAQAMLGDLIAVELPRPGTRFAANDHIGLLEGLLAPMELEAFANMEIMETNPRLEIHPDTVNRAPYGDGWVMKVRLKGLARWLDAPGYAEYLQKGMVNEGA